MFWHFRTDSGGCCYIEHLLALICGFAYFLASLGIKARVLFERTDHFLASSYRDIKQVNINGSIKIKNCNPHNQ